MDTGNREEREVTQPWGGRGEGGRGGGLSDRQPPRDWARDLEELGGVLDGEQGQRMWGAHPPVTRHLLASPVGRAWMRKGE